MNSPCPQEYYSLEPCYLKNKQMWAWLSVGWGGGPHEGMSTAKS